MTAHRDPLRRLFYLIAEPRVVRIIQLFVYVCMAAIGVLIIADSSSALRHVLGAGLVWVFASFLICGGVLGAISVLPGVWWMERAAVIAIVTGLAIYVVVAIALSISGTSLLVALALIGCMTKRWMEIRRYQVAP